MKTKIGKYVDGIVSKAEKHGLRVDGVEILQRTLAIRFTWNSRDVDYSKFIEDVTKKNKWEPLGGKIQCVDSADIFRAKISFFRRHK